MPGFRYQAFSVEGKLHRGVLEADSARQARTRSPSILDDGWRKCATGITSSEEVLRVTRED